MMSIRTKTIALLAAGGAALMLGLAAPAQATTTSGNCAPSKTKYLVYQPDGQQKTASDSFKTISATTVNFTQTTDGGCVIVRFSCQTFSMNNEVIIRPLMDNGILAAPTEVTYSGKDSGDTARAYAFDFVFENVPAGSHSIKMQVRGSGTGFDVFLTDHSMIVHY